MSPQSVGEVARRARQFYAGCSFPGYEDVETRLDLAGQGVLHAAPGSAAALVGADPGRGVWGPDNSPAPLYALSMMEGWVVGIDLSYNSLRRGQAFKERFELGSARFVQMDIFALGRRDAADQKVR